MTEKKIIAKRITLEKLETGRWGLAKPGAYLIDQGEELLDRYYRRLAGGRKADVGDQMKVTLSNGTGGFKWSKLDYAGEDPDVIGSFFYHDNMMSEEMRFTPYLKLIVGELFERMYLLFELG